MNRAGKGFTRTQLALGRGGVFGDFDNDGRPDLFSSWRRKLYRNTPDGRFSEEVALPDWPGAVSRGATWIDIDNDADLDLYVGGYHPRRGPYQPDVLLRNEGGEFHVHWLQKGDIDPARGITAADYDNDGDSDVYVSNYRLERNLLWQNDGSGNFTDVADRVGVGGIGNGYSHSFGHTIGSCWGDLDGDGLLDLFVGNFSHRHPHQDRPQFLRNLGSRKDYAFADESKRARLAWQESFASPAVADADNDGDLDIYFTTVYRGDHAVLLRNDGNWRFSDVTAESGLAAMPPTYGAAWADFDRDGDLDLCTGGRLYVNQAAGNHWLRIALRGDGVAVSLDAYGAQARIPLGETVLTRQVEAGTGQANQNEKMVHFGLGTEDGPVTVEIDWPGGRTDRLRDLTLDRTYKLSYGESVTTDTAEK